MTAVTLHWSMIFSENRFPLFRIMLLMNLRLGRGLRALQKIEVAAFVGLPDVLGIHRPIATQKMRRRRPPGVTPARQFVVADMQMDATAGDVDLDLGAGSPHGPRG